MELDVQQISKQYAQVQAIKQLSFGVKKGEIFALLGPNGAGKSSLIRMLSGFTQPDSGQIQVTINNNYYSSIPSHALGYLPEERGLYPEKSVLKNIVYFAQLNGVDRKAAIEQAKYWLERFDLLDRIDG
jgi:ABC-2 type transport system ATP-binding protein